MLGNDDPNWHWVSRERDEAAGILEYVANLQTQLAQCYAIARDNLKAAAQCQSKYHDTCIM